MAPQGSSMTSRHEPSARRPCTSALVAAICTGLPSGAVPDSRHLFATSAVSPTSRTFSIVPSVRGLTARKDSSGVRLVQLHHRVQIPLGKQLGEPLDRCFRPRLSHIWLLSLITD